MAGLLPPFFRCSAFWYAQARGLPVSLDYLKVLGLTAARMAWREGLEPWQVPEGPFFVYQWPERIWDAASTGLAVQPHLDQFWRQPPGYGDSFWSYPAPPEDTQAYADWEVMAAGERDAGWGPGQAPWDGDDIRPC
jgi:hypothetical protein